LSWLLIVLVVACLAIVARIYFNVRKVRSATDSDWDAKQIEHLRAQGSDPFQPHAVDFFFALPSEAAVQDVRLQLESDGFDIDTRTMPDSADQPFSVHARKSLRLSVPDMKDMSRRFGMLARSHGGRYDGWTAAVVPQTRDSQAH